MHSTLASARIPPSRRSKKATSTDKKPVLDQYSPRHPYSVERQPSAESPDTAFDKFYAMLEHISSRFANPLAFALTPLDGTAPLEATTSALESFYVVPRQEAAAEQSRSMEELKMENKELRAMVDNLSWKVHVYDQNVHSNSQVLQSSLVTLRNEVNAIQHHQRKPSTPQARNGDDEILGLKDRIKQLEVDNAELRTMNERQKSDLAKFERRWQKLKDNAKSRRVDGGALGNT
jgi:hypothetical protein